MGKGTGDFIYMAVLSCSTSYHPAGALFLAFFFWKIVAAKEEEKVPPALKQEIEPLVTKEETRPQTADQESGLETVLRSHSIAVLEEEQQPLDFDTWQIEAFQ
uniref:Uncharacterized protein n=1 Tax=Ditylenchus dipsaci TaxID=166011 RepID=A0A915ERJ2_9BILA